MLSTGPGWHHFGSRMRDHVTYEQAVMRVPALTVACFLLCPNLASADLSRAAADEPPPGPLVPSGVPQTGSL